MTSYLGDVPVISIAIQTSEAYSPRHVGGEEKGYVIVFK